MEFCDTVMEKSWNFVATISWQPCVKVIWDDTFWIILAPRTLKNPKWIMMILSWPMGMKAYLGFTIRWTRRDALHTYTHVYIITFFGFTHMSVCLEGVASGPSYYYTLREKRVPKWCPWGTIATNGTLFQRGTLLLGHQNCTPKGTILRTVK